jgi:hypothetical protein
MASVDVCAHFDAALLRELFDATTVTSSSYWANVQILLQILFWVESEEGVYAETKLLHLFAIILLSTPHRQVICPDGSTVLCIPLVHGLYPAAMNCWAFSRTYNVW